MTEIQWAQPAAALTTEASVGREKGSGVSLTNLQGTENEKSNSHQLLSYEKPETLENIRVTPCFPEVR